MISRTNIATDPRGTGTAEWTLSAFDESAGDPLSAFRSSRRFTRASVLDGSAVITNYAHLLDCYSGTTTGAITAVRTDDVMRYTYTTQGNTSYSDALAVYPTRIGSVYDTVPCKAGDTIRCQGEFRANRERSMRWRMRYLNASGAAVSNSNGAYSEKTATDWIVAPVEVWTVPDDPTIVACSPYLGSGPATVAPAGFSLDDWVEIRRAIITIDQTFPISGGYFDGGTLDLPPTDTAIGYRFDWTGTEYATASTATPIPQSVIGLEAPLPAQTDAVFRVQLRASEAMPGGRLVLRPDLVDPAGEVDVLIDLDFPAGESSLTLVASSGADPVAGLAFVWGADTGGPIGSSLEVTGILVEPTEPYPDPGEHPYFDGYTLDVPPTAIEPGVDYDWTGEPDASTSTATSTPPVRSETRAAIAAALSSIDSITGYPTAPRTLGRGQGWPVWQMRSPLTMRSDELRWLVHVTLPAGMADATVLEADDLIDYVLAALSTVGVIEQIEPDALLAVQDRGSQPVPALTVTMTTTT